MIAYNNKQYTFRTREKSLAKGASCSQKSDRRCVLASKKQAGVAEREMAAFHSRCWQNCPSPGVKRKCSPLGRSIAHIKAVYVALVELLCCRGEWRADLAKVLQKVHDLCRRLALTMSTGGRLHQCHGWPVQVVGVLQVTGVWWPWQLSVLWMCSRAVTLFLMCVGYTDVPT
jgi:hypothetical protein